MVARAESLKGHLDMLPGLRPRLELEVIGHLEDAATGHRERGLSPAEAEERAVRDFGAPDIVARQLLDELGGPVVTMRTAMVRWSRRSLAGAFA